MSILPKTRSKNASKIRDELDYAARLKQLESLGKTLEIDNTERIASYYKGSPEMIKTADAQYSDNQLENAFISYLKFLDLFCKKITQHVDYKRVPLSTKSTNQYYQRHAQNRVKELRRTLLQRYKEIASLYRNQECGTTGKKFHKREKSVSNSVFKSRSISHTDAIDRSAFDLDACRSLRTVVVPKQLPTIFQIVTQKMKKLSGTVWATLAGQLINNEYVITHLILPKQETLDVVDIHKNPCRPYATKRHLKILGWIHLHTPGSCYMSVTDLHVQYQFQTRVPEAIAIVCAPMYTQVETYMLMKHGIDFIGNCSKEGIHSHNISRPLYTFARHAKVVYHLQFQWIHLDEIGDDESEVNDHSSHTW